MPANNKSWWLYLLRTNQGTLYTGISTDVQKRFTTHAAGNGAKYLRGKGPLKLEYQVEVGSHSNALKIETHIKQLPKTKKEDLIRSGIEIKMLLQSLK